MEHGGFDPGPHLAAYAELVRASPHNLLSRVGLEELESRHIPECVRFARRLPEVPAVLDLGSGGGLPGIVIAITRPDVEVHLLEATSKKADFLAGVGAELGLRIRVHNGRAEKLTQGVLAGAFRVVTARAVARLPRLIDLCAPFLAAGGQLHAIKGEQWADEVTESTSVMRRRGLVLRSTPDDAPGEDPRVVVLERPAGPGSTTGPT